jgi:RNA polymerase sigma-70 factor (ECF subfamily)
MKITKYSNASDLWLTYQNSLTRYLHRRTGSETTARELSHRVLLRVVDSCCSGREVRNERAWLYQICRNVLVDFYKERGGGARVPSPPEDRDIPDVVEELAVYVRPLIDLLPEKYALPLRLADIENLPQRAVADRLGLGLSATKTRIQRARLMLRAKIVECTYLETDAAGRPVDFILRPACACLQLPSTTDCNSRR